MNRDLAKFLGSTIMIVWALGVHIGMFNLAEWDAFYPNTTLLWAVLLAGDVMLVMGWILVLRADISMLRRSLVVWVGLHLLGILAAVGVGLIVVIVENDWYIDTDVIEVMMVLISMCLVFGYYLGSTLLWRKPGSMHLQLPAGVGGEAKRVTISCPGCGYNMAGLQQAKCPECGVVFTLDQLMAEVANQSAG